jgi:preprotein translocase subunit Sec61beta
LLLSAAGIIYMVSGGDPTRVKLAKKIVVGVASGVGLIILARVIFNVLGVMPAWNV